MKRRVIAFSKADLSYSEMMNSFQGWCAYSKWANSYKLRKEILKEIHKAKREYTRNKQSY
ncbi:MAG: hypothetical protein AABW80_05025 [Nanoarchaeota archaeon]